MDRKEDKWGGKGQTRKGGGGGRVRRDAAPGEVHGVKSAWGAELNEETKREIDANAHCITFGSMQKEEVRAGEVIIRWEEDVR
jgi:hypothetical protein